MKVKELKNILSQYDDELDVLIDKSIDGYCTDITDMQEYDVQKYDDKHIIINYQT